MITRGIVRSAGLVALVAALALAGCSNSSPTAEDASAATPTDAATSASPTPTPSATLSATPSDEPAAASSSPTATPSPTKATTAPKSTPSKTPSASPTPSPDSDNSGHSDGSGSGGDSGGQEPPHDDGDLALGSGDFIECEAEYSYYRALMEETDVVDQAQAIAWGAEINEAEQMANSGDNARAFEICYEIVLEMRQAVPPAE